jgi:hypothetical protein
MVGMTALDELMAYTLVAQAALSKLLSPGEQIELKGEVLPYTLQIDSTEDKQFIIVRRVPDKSEGKKLDPVPPQVATLDLLGQAVLKLMEQKGVDEVRIPISELQPQNLTPDVAAEVMVIPHSIKVIKAK